jgi:hypothetical protein
VMRVFKETTAALTSAEAERPRMGCEIKPTQDGSAI